MVNICVHCDKVYKSRQSLCNHNRKFHNSEKVNCGDNVVENVVEKPIKKYDCSICNKSFKDRSNKHKHEIICKEKESDKLKELIELKNKDIEILKLKLELKSKTTNINNGVINNINNNNIINNFNNDNLDYISEKFMNKMFKHLLFEDEYNIPIPKIIENIKFNPNHKENNNVKIKNMRSKIGYKYSNNKWNTVNEEELLNDLFKLGTDVFLKFYKERYDKLSDNMKECYEEFIEASRNELKAEIKEKIKLLGYIYTKNEESIIV